MHNQVKDKGGVVLSSPVSPNIGAVYIPVKDIYRSRDWYCDLLGFSNDGEVRFGHLYVIPTEGPNVVLDSKIYKEGMSLSYPLFHFNTNDIYKAYSYVQERGIELLTEIEHDHYFTFRDIDGNVLMICQC